MVIQKYACILLCTLILASCQTVGYEPISENVRVSTTYEDDKKLKIIGSRIEMNVSQSNGMFGWFEAEKTADGTYKLTLKGEADKAQTENMSSSDDSGGDSGGGGGGGSTC